MARRKESTLNLTWREYLPVGALIIALVSMLVSIATFRRTSKLQRFDYAPRLQLAEETMEVGGADAKDAFSYSVALENPGSKPVRVDAVYMDYGSKARPTGMMKYRIEGEFYLPAGGRRPIACVVSGSETQKVMRNLGTDICSFHLRVCVHTDHGIVERHRTLVQINQGGGGMYVVPRGDIIL
ncbi:MAG: hypothetical protein ACKVU1_02770 [bacterium]